MLEQPPIDQSQENKPKMNRTEEKQILITAGNSLLIFVAVYGTFGALVSSFSITVNMTALFWLWMVGAVIASIVTMRYRGKGLLILSCAAMVLFLFNYRDIIDGFMLVVREITIHFNRWIPVSVLFPEAQIEIEEPVFFIAAAGIVVTILLSFSICLRRSLLNTILITAPIVFLTFVITDLQADLIYLFCLIAVYITLLICSAVSPDDYIKRGKVLLPAFVSAMVIMLIAYMFAPYGSYSREENIAALGNRFRVIVYRISGFGSMWQPGGMDLGWLGMFGNGIWQFNTENVDIANSGQRPFTNQTLLEVTVNEPGTFYLRGFSMRDFNGRSWSISDQVESLPNEEIAREMPAIIANTFSMFNTYNPPRIAEMKITRTGDLTQHITYQPYYSGAFLNEGDGLIAEGAPETFIYTEESIHKLLEALDEYGIFIVTGEENALRRLDIPDSLNISIFDMLQIYAGMLYSQGYYTRVPGQIAHELRWLAEDAGIDPYAERTVVADAVAKYIMSSGSYSLSPDLYTPPGEDFVINFLKNADEGYCIHFATAAVMMLRALDIPARFVSGYIVTVPWHETGNPVVLTDRNAHAWVEVFYDDIGWLYLEVTPAGENSFVPSPRPHTPASSVTATPAPQPSPPPVDNTSPPEMTPPEEINVPSNGATRPGDTQDIREIPAWLQNIGIAGACIVICLLLVLIRRSAAGKRRENHFKQKNTNKAAVYIWRYIMQLSDNNEAQPGNIEALALKARFSQHRLTGEERSVMVSYAKKLAEDTYNRQTRFGRFWLKYIQALY